MPVDSPEKADKAAIAAKVKTLRRPETTTLTFYPVARIELPKVMAQFISLFSGAGGLDVGFEQAGFDCVYASDVDPIAVETLRANRGFPLSNGRRALSATKITCADVRDLRSEHILGAAGCRSGDVPLLIGGPPCQSWSSCGHQLGFDDPRGRLINDYVELADALGVRWVVLENVRGLVTARGPDGLPGSALGRIREMFLRKGFQTSLTLLNGADYGIPQRRVRLFIIAYRAGDKPTWPAPTHDKHAGAKLLPWVSMGECLGSGPPLGDDEIIRPRPTLAEQLAALRPGTGVKSPGKAETTRPGGHWGYKQGAFLADLALPARTITASAQQDWILDSKLGLRRLTATECAALQTFPNGWVFAGKGNDHYRLIGNAVPPLLAAHVASAMLPGITRTTKDASPRLDGDLSPLPKGLQAAIDYTVRDGQRNGESRMLSPSRRSRRGIFMP